MVFSTYLFLVYILTNRTGSLSFATRLQYGGDYRLQKKTGLTSRNKRAWVNVGEYDD